MISMAVGAVSAAMLPCRHCLDRVGSLSLLWFVPLPLLVSAILWAPMFRTYPMIELPFTIYYPDDGKTCW
jgi:hypothetical protein